ncbi:hypothetical protein MM1218R_01546 [Mycobacterium marinum]|nr:hypothetical protein MM1218R_01546 [Mycobacterium marinum]RFZ11454.1 hypothetical protein DE4381_01042 [Mycobacterium marinum]
MRAQKRLMRQMEKPAFLRQVFYDEVKRRGGSMFEFWSRILSEFVQLLIGSLGLYRLRVEQVGEVDRTSYELLRDGDSTGNMWLLRIFDQGEAELLVWLGYSSWRTAHAIHDSNREPALYFSVRSPKERMEPYRRTYEHELGGLREIVLIPGMPSRVYAAFSSLKVGGLEDSADFIAEQIGRSFSKGEILSNPA